ncbi:MAG TPA: PAS domain S-box protein [Thermoanaerobaculia bacterium]|nr:PAS domain S-box protein [Thermoanaerobaculia bacterium]
MLNNDPDDSAVSNRASNNLLTRSLAKVVELMPVGVTVTDLEGTILYVNPAEAKMHGFENPVDLIGKEIPVLAASGGGRTMTWKEIAAMKSWRRESLNRRQDGSLFPVELVSDLVTDAEGQPAMIVTACLDLSRFQQNEVMLRRLQHDSERLVAERTFKLEADRRKLESELAERTRAEEELRGEVARLQASLAAEVETTQKLRQGASDPGADDVEVTVKIRPEDLPREEPPRPVEPVPLEAHVFAL